MCSLFLPALLLFGGAHIARAQLERPVITSITRERTNVVVTVRVPPGIRRVTLECRDRLAATSWEPRAVTRLDGTGGLTTFRLPISRQMEVMRVRGDTTDPLPSSFYTGTNAFLGSPGSGDMGAMVAPTDSRTPPTSTTDASRDVVESDIWKIRDQALYFFNQYRGLQVIDISNPDSAKVRGTLELPAAGEQMYLLGTKHVVLLARNGCSYNESQVLIVADNDGTPSVVAHLPVPGYIQESRMVGTALYVASQTYRPVSGTTNTTWEWGTLVSSFDLSDPSAPVARNTLWYSGYGNVVAATDIYLFVVTQDPANWWQSIVRVVDITAPDGTMNAYGSIRTAGHVTDKFKLDYTGAIFTSISEDWHWDNGTRLVTKLETFRLPDPRSLGPAGIIKLGELELGRGERLRATRFDGSRVYVVTFFQIDPLWVVDLSNPSAPRIAGSVEVPGWSTYIQPLDDRLVTLGIVSNRVAVSLFDVKDPAAPALLSRVLLGQNYSWSEANYNEKAFTVLPGIGLILVPFNGDVTNRYASLVQLIDFDRGSLKARGQIEGSFPVRRATVYTDRILAISGEEYLSVDAADRDHPVVRGQIDLAWPVDRVFLQGDYLLELAANSWWGNQSAPMLRVALASTPNEVLGRLSLANLPVLGATARGGRLYIAQGLTSWFYPLPLADAGTTDTDPNSPTFLLTVIGLDDLPAVQVLGQTQIKTGPLGWGDWQPVWPKPDVLVWAGGGFNFWRFPIATLGAPAAGGASIVRPWPPFWGGGGGRLIAFDVSDSAAPKFASEVNLTTNNWWSFSKAFTAEGLVYLSHQKSEFIVGLTSPWQTSGEPAITVDPVTSESVTNAGPIGTWVQMSLLDVVDYADPKDPLVRRPVNIPGTLNGISHQGSLLYTIGPHWDTNWSYAWTEYLDASAYDGVSAHLVDSLALPTAWPHPVLVVGPNIFIGRPGYASGYTSGLTDVKPHTLETWKLSDAGKFAQLGSVTLAMPANMLADFPGMLAVQETDNTVDLYDARDAGALRRIGQTQPSACWWFDLSHADGSVNHGLWIPLGIYGVATVPISP